MSSSNDDGQQNFIVGIVFALIALVLFLVIGIAIHTMHGKGAVPAKAVGTAAPRMAVVTETVSVVIPDGASIRVVGGVVNFYFASGSADLAPGAAEALAAVYKGVQGGKKAKVSGFHDTTGDPAINEELAKKRAVMVRDVLVGLGVAADKVDLQKPAVSAGSGNNAEARRVEVTLVE